LSRCGLGGGSGSKVATKDEYGMGGNISERFSFLYNI